MARSAAAVRGWMFSTNRLMSVARQFTSRGLVHAGRVHRGRIVGAARATHVRNAYRFCQGKGEGPLQEEGHGAGGLVHVVLRCTAGMLWIRTLSVFAGIQHSVMTLNWLHVCLLSVKLHELAVQPADNPAVAAMPPDPQQSISSQSCCRSVDTSDAATLLAADGKSTTYGTLKHACNPSITVVRCMPICQ